MDVALRELADRDLDRLFRWELNPGAVAMAAFTRADAADREAFDRHHARIRANPETVLLAIDADGDFAGTVGSYPVDGEREVTYWIDPARWGRGIASAALRAYLGVETVRPLAARVAAHNLGSAAVLERAGFVRVGTDSGYAEGVGREVVEHVYRLAER